MSNQQELKTLSANAAITLLTTGASIIAFYLFGGLFPAIIASLVVLPSLMALAKLAKIKIEPLQYVALFFLTVLGLPAILLNNLFMAKIQDPISGLIMGLGFAAISWFYKEPVIKKLIPQYFKNHRFFQKYLISVTDASWKKIDYLWAVEMTLSAALSMAAVFLFPTSVWFIAKYTIGPVLSFFAFGLTAKTLHTGHTQQPLITPEFPPPALLFSPPEVVITQYPNWDHSQKIIEDYTPSSKLSI